MVLVNNLCWVRLPAACRKHLNSRIPMLLIIHELKQLSFRIHLDVSAAFVYNLAFLFVLFFWI